jgi:hypothetical protein
MTRHPDGSDVFVATAAQRAERELEDQLELALAQADLDAAERLYAIAELGVQRAQAYADETMRGVQAATARLRAAQRCDECHHAGRLHVNAHDLPEPARSAAFAGATCWAESVCQGCAPELARQLEPVS